MRICAIVLVSIPGVGGTSIVSYVGASRDARDSIPVVNSVNVVEVPL